MIKLNKLNKYYNRNKTNEIHVINDINLDLPDKGLVVLLGPSGSGKTTLLNVLGGLDKVQNGSIVFDSEEITHYKSGTWDKIRNRKVGYIFQNYNLLSNLTVYDNIALTLNMIGIYDKDEIDKRIDYILDSMGMINYRKRKASQLSGGQQQRVAIARALAKNPQVIIADEPTGNLDSKNTQDIMNIIKNISMNKLVVLVTHEENIANFYGDRIIRLRDGQIVDDINNSSNGELDVHHETDIYLGDLRQVVDSEDGYSSLKVYTDEGIDDLVDVRLIVKNKTLYLDVKSKEYKKIQLLEKDSEIKIFDRKYEKLQKDSFTNDSQFDLDEVVDNSIADYTRHSVISIKDSLRLALNRLRGASRLGKLFYFGFAAGAILIAISVGMLSGVLSMDAEDFLDGPKNNIGFAKGDLKYADLLLFTEDESIEYLQVVGNFSFNAKLPTIFQNLYGNTSLGDTIIYSEYLNDSKIIMGRGIEDYNEIVIDSNVADRLIGNSEFNYLGVDTYEDLLEIDYFITLNGFEGPFNYIIKIVGIVDDESTSIYAHKELVFMQRFGVGIYEVFEDDITLEQGTLIENSNEVIIVESDTWNSPLALNKFTYFEEEFIAVGTFTSTVEVPVVLIKTEQLEGLYFDYTYQGQRTPVHVYAKNIDDALDFFVAQGIDAESNYQEQYNTYRSNRLANSIGSIIFSSVVFGASAISFFFIIRSSLLSRIYEVSVYRALGVTKNDIRKMFTTEVIMITTMTSFIGYSATTYLLYRVQLMSADFFDIINITPLSIIIGLVSIYTINVISGLIPVSNLLRKTPAEILSKYDF